MIFRLKFSKGHYSVINVGGKTVLTVCTLSHSAYICTRFHENISNNFRVIERTRFLYLKFQTSIILSKM